MRISQKLSWKHSLFALSMVFQIVPVGCTTFPPVVEGQLVEQRENFTGTIDFSTDKISPFTLKGKEANLGEYTARGEVRFRQVDVEGTLIGDGVAVFETANGDLLVAVVTWPVDVVDGDLRAGEIEFRWRDSVQFSDGSVVESTGQFADPEDRPPGLVVIAIIAILIGMLLPAVQK